MSEMPIKNHLQGVASPPEGNKLSPLTAQAPPEGLITQKLVAEVAAGRIPPQLWGGLPLATRSLQPVSAHDTQKHDRKGKTRRKAASLLLLSQPHLSIKLVTTIFGRLSAGFCEKSFKLRLKTIHAAAFRSPTARPAPKKPLSEARCALPPHRNTPRRAPSPHSPLPGRRDGIPEVKNSQKRGRGL